MGEPAAGRARTIIVLGPRADDAVVAHARGVLNHFGIPFAEVGWQDVAAFVAGGGMSGVGVVLFATGVPYTDEHLRLLDDVNLPGIRLITDPQPPPEHLLTGTPLMATAGVGVRGAIDAGLIAARILALTDRVLKELFRTNPYPAPPTP